jgi:antibiotic biosynthesis monooxygenase (ABM) superfamily enzyme
MAKTGSESGQATVVITSRIRHNRDTAFREWQEDVNAAASRFAGFVGAEVIPPVDGIQDEWTTIYRFDSPEHLASWMASEERSEALTAGSDLFEEAPQQVAMTGGGIVDSGYTMIVPHRVKPENVPAFLELQRAFDAQQRGFPGYRGSELLRPVPGISEEWTALVRFENQEAMQAWIDAPVRQRFLDELDELVESYEVREVGSSFGSWFAFDTIGGKPTPNWKQWLAVLLALYPVVMLLGFVTGRLPGGAKSSIAPVHWFFLNLWIGNLFSTFLLAFLIMPIVSRGLQFWLRPNAAFKVTVLGTVLVVALYALTITIFGVACRSGC